MDETADTVEFLAASGTIGYAHSTHTHARTKITLHHVLYSEDLIRAELNQSQAVVMSDPQVSDNCT